MKLKKLFTVIISIILVLSLASCDSFMNIVDKIIEQHENGKNSQNTESEEENDVELDPVVVDPNWPASVFGTELSSAPEKVVCATPALCEYINDMGLLERLDGVCGNCPFEIPKGLPNIGSVLLPDMEILSGLSPKYLLTFAQYDEDSLIKLQQMDTEVIVIKAPESLDSLRDLYRELAVFFLGAEDGKTYGEDYVKKYDSALSEIEYSGEKVSAAFLRRMDFLMFTGDTLAGEILSRSFDNVAEEYTDYEYPEESWKEFEPSIIFVTGRIHIEDLESSDLYKKKIATKGDKIFSVDLDAISVGGLRSFEIIKDMLSTAYKDYTGGNVLEPAYPSLYKK